ncbi:hypothetical protein V5738_00340 [Salinisphaera sp. SPP-AMP-43]|uniref:hypothetical protein n=1 Tax=Salinisphaera sp. SPP-AMP-43 TaxID=3121288 RepID=UPI003C6E5754
MPTSSSYPAYHGGLLLLAAAFAAVITAAIDTVSTGNAIAFTLGTYLVLGSTAVLLILAMLLVASGVGRFVRGLLFTLIFIDLLATGLAAYFLTAHLLLAFVALGLLGWAVHLFIDPPLYTAPRAKVSS